MQAMTTTKMICACAVLATLSSLGLAAPVGDVGPDPNRPPSRQGRRIDTFPKDARLGITANTAANNNPAPGLFSSFNFNNVIPQFTIGTDDLLAGLTPNIGNVVTNGIAVPTSSWDWNIFGTSGANPIDKIDIGTATVPLPNLPALPSVPALPSLPALPTLPTPQLGTVSIDVPVPSLPSLPSPSLPSLSLPDFSSTSLFPSGIPKPSLPSLPTLPTLPTIALPSLPSFPSFPSFSLPSLQQQATLPGIPAPETQLLVIRYPDILSFFGSAYDTITTPLSSFFNGFTNLFGGNISTGTLVATIP